jgi:glycosyltransferase involved in cell wall biosynthesis
MAHRAEAFRWIMLQKALDSRMLRPHMHIAINAHLLAHTRSFRRAGVSHHIEQVLHHLSQLDRRNQYTVYTTRGLDNSALGLPGNFAVRSSFLPTINPRLRIPWEQFLAPLLLRTSKASLYHGMLNVVPFACPVPSVVTVHDLAFIRFPHTFRAYNRTYLDFATRISVKRASHVLTVSEYIKHEVVHLLGVPPERVTVTYNAAREHFRPPDQQILARFRQSKDLPDQFVLYVGTLEPRKNLTTLLDAYATVARQHKAPLIVGGGKGWLYGPIFEQLERLGLREQVRFVGYIEEEELPLWYAAATAFAFPSIYEGFGMPPLEAMACGTPVVVANSASLPEVVGDAGLLVNPHDSEALAAALLRLLNEAELRAELRERGLRQARAFTWQEAAQRTLEVYQRIA